MTPVQSLREKVRATAKRVLSTNFDFLAPDMEPSEQLEFEDSITNAILALLPTPIERPDHVGDATNMMTDLAELRIEPPSYENIRDEALFRKRNNARTMVRAALGKGRLVKPLDCEICGIDPGVNKGGASKLQGHHHAGYDEPLNVQWLCVSCHRAVTPVAFGEKNAKAKLSEGQVKKILASPLDGAEVARLVGVDRKTVNRIREGSQWTHISLLPSKAPSWMSQEQRRIYNAGFYTAQIKAEEALAAAEARACFYERDNAALLKSGASDRALAAERDRDALQARLDEAEGALERIAHPEYGLGFNKLRGIARRYLASKETNNG